MYKYILKCTERGMFQFDKLGSKKRTISCGSRIGSNPKLTPYSTSLLAKRLAKPVDRRKEKTESGGGGCVSVVMKP